MNHRSLLRRAFVKTEEIVCTNNIQYDVQITIIYIDRRKMYLTTTTVYKLNS
jgi:hypothetical protein